MLPDTPQVLPANFRGDRPYTLQALVEELALIERHIRDGSWRICKCNPEKHLPLVAGLASEGFGFAKDLTEREFMRRLRDYSRLIREKIMSGDFLEADANELREHAREARHRITEQQYEGAITENPELEEHSLSVLEAMVEIHALSGGLQFLEEAHVDAILNQLSLRDGIPKPPVEWMDKCNPMTDAYQDGLTVLETGEDGETRRRSVEGSHKIHLCRGGANVYSVAHEYCHIRDLTRSGETSEESATRCGLDAAGNTLLDHEKAKTLNALSLDDPSGGEMSNIIKAVEGKLPLIAGAVVGAFIDESGYVDNFLSPYTKTYTPLAKAGVGAVLVGAGVTKLTGNMKDIAIGAGIVLAASGITQQFFRPAALRASAALSAAIPASNIRLTATGMRMGHPTLTVVKRAPRPGILAPSNLSPSMSGKWMLGTG